MQPKWSDAADHSSAGCMYATATKVKELEYFTRLNSDFHSDLSWWHSFLTVWNGVSLLHYVYLILSQTLEPHTSFHKKLYEMEMNTSLLHACVKFRLSYTISVLQFCLCDSVRHMMHMSLDFLCCTEVKLCAF